MDTAIWWIKSILPIVDGVDSEAGADKARENESKQQFTSVQWANFASTTQPVHTTQQCSYMGAWASLATVPFI